MNRKTILFLAGLALLSFVAVIYTNQAASFNKYAPKLLKFEGEGYGIHKPIWGEKVFTKKEALYIHRHHYWNRYHGNWFASQEVAEVFIDHLINAGEGKEGRNIKAFERIIGVRTDGVLTRSDIAVANSFEDPSAIVNPYVNYRLSYYRTRKEAGKYPGWVKRAKSFYVDEPQKENNSSNQENVMEEYIKMPSNKTSTTPQRHSEMVIEDLN